MYYILNYWINYPIHFTLNTLYVNIWNEVFYIKLLDN